MWPKMNHDMSAAAAPAHNGPASSGREGKLLRAIIFRATGTTFILSLPKQFEVDDIGAHAAPDLTRKVGTTSAVHAVRYDRPLFETKTLYAACMRIFAFLWCCNMISVYDVPEKLRIADMTSDVHAALNDCPAVAAPAIVSSSVVMAGVTARPQSPLNGGALAFAAGAGCFSSVSNLPRPCRRHRGALLPQPRRWHRRAGLPPMTLS